MCTNPFKPAVFRSERMYRLLLGVYPRAFRREYGPAMAQLFRDQCGEACQKEGRWGLMKVWWRGLVDLGRSATLEQMSNLNEKLNMTSTPWFGKTQRRLALAVFILICGLALVGTWLLPRYFVSTVRLAVMKDTADSPDHSQPAATIYDPYFVQTEFEKLRSKAVLYPVIERLKLNERWARKLGLERPLSTQEAFLLLQKSLDLRQHRNTSLIEIRAFSEDPKEAAEIANTAADVYRGLRARNLEVASIQGIEALQRELGEQAASIRDSQATVDKLREQGNIPIGTAEGQELGGAERLRQLESQALEAELASAQLEALRDRLCQLDRKELRQVLPTAFPDTLLTELLTRYNQAEVDLLALKRDRGPEHPEMLRAQSVLSKLDEQIEQRISGILAGLELKARNLTQERELRLKALSFQQNQISDKASKYEVYFTAKRELEIQKQMHQAIALRLQQEKMEANLPKTASVEIIDRAEPSLRPVRPNVPLNIAAGILLGLVASAVVVLLMLFKSLLTRPTAVGA
jgi:polysaccharide biosynthesis transport protein